MRTLLAALFVFTALFSIEPANASRHGAFGTVPIGKKVTVQCFNASGAVYQKNGWFLASVGSAPDNIILSEDPKNPENSKTVVITLSGNWDCVIETV